MMFVYFAAIAAVSGAVWLAVGVRKIGAISRGKPIGQRTEEALLLIDLQSVFWDRGPYSDAAKQSAKDAIMREIDMAKAQRRQVIAVRQEWSVPSTKAVARLTMKGHAIEGSDGTELAKSFAGLADHVLVKRVQDAFETGELDALLAKLGVGRLRIAGLDFGYCVLKTALAARNRGFKVTVVKKATLSAGSGERAEERMAASGVGLD